MNKLPLKLQFQAGMTLIELMIGMTLGLLLLAGLIQIFVSAKTSYLVQDAVARIEENSRFSLDTLTGSIRLAGYKTDPWEDGETVFTAATLFPTAGQYISGADGGASGSDQINIRYRGSVDAAGVADGRVLDCDGTSVADTTVELSFSLSGSDLICTINGAAPSVVIANDVVNMQILYGEDTTNDGSANKYNKVPSGDVVSVKLGLVFSSESSLANNAISFPSLSDNPMNVMFDHDADGDPDLFKSSGSSDFDTRTAPDKRIYKVYATTITLRNSVL